MVTAAISNPIVLGNIVRQLRADRADLVHIQCVSESAWFAYQAARITRIPCVVTLQGELTMDATGAYARSALLRRTLRMLLARADAVTACSRATLTEAESWAGLELGARGRVVHNGVDTREFAGALSSQRDHVLFAIGRHVPQKGFDLLIDAFALLVADADFDADLVLAGDGPESTSLVDQVARSGLSHRVRFVGRTDRATTVELFASAKLFVLPSRHEPFGIVILEAMAAGAPVVASAVGGVPEFVQDGVNGVLAPPGNANALASAIRRVWSTPDLAYRLTHNARSQAARFDWSLIERQYREVYAFARAAHAGQPPAVL
jgi:glycosyltransferase involved in cell wall biosynthesis